MLALPDDNAFISPKLVVNQLSSPYDSTEDNLNANDYVLLPPSVTVHDDCMISAKAYSCVSSEVIPPPGMIIVDSTVVPNGVNPNDH